MAQYLEDILVVTKDELVPRYWSHYQSLQRRLDSDEKRGYGLKCTQRGGGMDTTLPIKFDTPSKRSQVAISNPQKYKCQFEQFHKAEKEIMDYYNDYQYLDGSYLIPETVEQLIINASVIKAIVRLEAIRESELITKSGCLRGIANMLYIDAHAFNAELAKEKYKRAQHNLNSYLRIHMINKSLLL